MKAVSLRYEVWVLGYDKDDFCTDIETLLETFDNKSEAIEFAKKFNTIDDIITNYNLNQYPESDDYLEIVVETIKNGDETNRNIETAYSNYLY